MLKDVKLPFWYLKLQFLYQGQMECVLVSSRVNTEMQSSSLKSILPYILVCVWNSV